MAIKERKTRTVTKEVTFFAYELHEVSLVINRKLRDSLYDKLKEFGRAKSEISAFAGFIVYAVLRSRDAKKNNELTDEVRKMDEEMIRYYLTLAKPLNEKHPIRDRKHLSETDRNQAHYKVIRFQATDPFISQLSNYAKVLTKLMHENGQASDDTLSIAEVIYVILCYAQERDLPVRRKNPYIDFVSKSGLKESLVKDVLEKMER